MKITNSLNTTINTVAPKVIETGNGFLINTQYYTKERLSAVALEFLKLTGSPYALSTRKQLFLQTQDVSWRNANDEVEIFKDSTYPNRYYVRVISGYIESRTPVTYIAVLEEAENKELNCLAIIPFSEMYIMDIADQDDNNLYVVTRTSNISYIYTVNKNTFVATNRHSIITQSRSFVTLTKTYSDDGTISV